MPNHEEPPRSRRLDSLNGDPALILASILDTTPRSIVITDTKGVIRYVNLSWERLSGWTSAEVVGKVTPRILKSGRICPTVYEKLWRTILDGSVFQGEFVNKRKDGSIYSVEAIIAPVRDAAGRITHFFGNETDIGRRKNDEKQLRLFRRLIDQSNDDIRVVDPTSGRYLYVNDRTCVATGYSREELLAMRVGDLIPSLAEPSVWEKAVKNLRETGTLINETMHRNKDASERPIEANVRYVRDPSGEYIIVVVRDISERRRAQEALKQREEEFHQAQKMEAVGRLAGGIAHDFNNLLTAIGGYAEFVLQSLEAADPRRADVEEIKKAGARAAALTRQLLTFSRKQALQPQVVDLNAAAEETRKMLARVIGEDIELALSPADRPARVNIDPGAVGQILLNLAVNARDAMPHGGRIAIEIGFLRLETARLHKHGLVTPGDYVVLSMSDTGSGMSPEIQAHLFEPFFTTKEKNKGTGLGLSTIYGLVNQSGGHIQVSSTPGRGTTFKIYLPRAEETVAAAPSDTMSKKKLSTPGPGRILLAEDEAPLRQLVRRVLLSTGLTVLEATDGEQALKIAGNPAAPIDLLLTAMVMPGMTGPELAEVFLRRHPRARVIFMSDYNDQKTFAAETTQPGRTFLQKPFTPDALLDCLRRALASR